MRLLATLVFLLFVPSLWADEIVDLELVLAVDASASVDDSEFRLQIGGIASAFRDPEVQAAIAAGPVGRIAVALNLWGDAEVPSDQTGWYSISSAAEASALASIIGGLPRRVTGGTGMGAGLGHAMRMFDRNGFQGRRQVVDVSGDGKETPPRIVVLLMPDARSMAHARSITINGLAILNEDRELAAWYRSEVATGPGHFVMAVDDYGDFAEAMRRKLIREIEGARIISLLE